MCVLLRLVRYFGVVWFALQKPTLRLAVHVLAWKFTCKIVSRTKWGLQNTYMQSALTLVTKCRQIHTVGFLTWRYWLSGRRVPFQPREWNSSRYFFHWLDHCCQPSGQRNDNCIYPTVCFIWSHPLTLQPWSEVLLSIATQFFGVMSIIKFEELCIKRSIFFGHD